MPDAVTMGFSKASTRVGADASSRPRLSFGSMRCFALGVAHRGDLPGFHCETPVQRRCLIVVAIESKLLNELVGLRQGAR